MLLLLAFACSQTEPDEILTGVHDEAGNHPLVPEVPLLPWPSSMWLEDDASMATGVRLAIPEAHRPDVGDYAVFEAMDGFSRVTPMVTWFEGGVDPATLPTLPESVSVDSPVLLVNTETLALEPALVEVDGYADLATQSLLIRPQVTLAPDTDYAVLITDQVAHADGTPLEASTAFRALRDGILTDSTTVEARRDDFAALVDAIDGLGIEPTSVVHGWVFHTRSASQIIDPLVAMHDHMMTATLGDWTEVSREDDGSNTVIEGTVEVPDFLGDDERLSFGSDGLPVVEGTRIMDVQLTIPHTIDEPRPVLVFGHGFFSSRDEPTWGSLQQSLQPWRTTAVSTDFIGLTEDDFVDSAGGLAGDMDVLARIVDQQRQSHANHTALVRVIEEQLGSAIAVEGANGPFAPMDPTVVNYLGISNGGTQGYTLFAASPAFTRGALVVGGGGWSHITQRATQWYTLGALLGSSFDDERELQVVLGLMQQVFDPIDSLNFAEHLVEDRLPGRPPVEISLHMAVGDAQVHNMTTEWVARAAGIPLVVPSAREVWGLETLDASADGVDVPAGLVIYDEGYPRQEPGNVAPLQDNGAHETIRDLLSYRENVGLFLETGDIVQVCEGACDPD